ncbi:hypothetical protein Droror1_Dr00018098 [Drosera rotundifolia]
MGRGESGSVGWGEKVVVLAEERKSLHGSSSASGLPLSGSSDLGLDPSCRAANVYL